MPKLDLEGLLYLVMQVLLVMHCCYYSLQTTLVSSVLHVCEYTFDDRL